MPDAHACPCGKTFRHREHLNRHALAHHGQKRHICEICDRAFARGDVLRRHRTKHQVDDQRDVAGNRGSARVPMACNRCHLRKERCSGGIPCGRCQVKGSQCRYSRVSSLSSLEDPPLSHASARSRRGVVATPSSTFNKPLETQLGKRINHPGPDPDPSNQSSLFDNSCSAAEEDICSYETLARASPASWPLRANGRDDWSEEMPLVQVQMADGAFARCSLAQGVDCYHNSSFGAATAVANASAQHNDAALTLSEIQLPASGTSRPAAIFDWQSSSATEVTASVEEMLNPVQLNRHSLDHGHPSILSTPLWIRALAPLLCTDMLLGLYFTEFSHCWPLLHRGRFFSAVKQQPLELLCAVALIGTLYQPENGEHDGKDVQKSAARSLHEWLLSHLSAYLNQRREEGPGGCLPHSAADLAAAQALLLNVIYGICIDQVSLRVRLSSAFHTLTDYLRDANLLQHSHLPPTSTDADEYSRWLTIEAAKRLVFTAFRLDAYLSLFYDHRGPVLRFQEVAVPLPCSDAMWDAADRDAWRSARQLEPNGRLRKTFSALCAAAFAGAAGDAMPVLLEEDHEIALCAMQARLWEDAQARHEQAAYSRSGNGALGRVPDGASQADGGRSESWQVQLEYWRVHRDRSQQLNAHYSSPAHRRRMRFNGTMMYLLSYLRMHADIPLIRRFATSLDRQRGGPEFPPASVTPRRLESQVSAWAGSRNARVALRCAAQIFQLYRQEVDGVASMFQRIDPISVGCTFRAALVVWAYARSTLSCEMCTGFSAEHSENVQSNFFGPQAVCELAAAGGDLDLHAISSWVSRGGKASMNGVPICVCSLPQLVGSFISVIRRCTAVPDFVIPLVDVLEHLQYHH